MESETETITPLREYTAPGGPGFSLQELEYIRLYIVMNKKYYDEINAKLNADFDAHPFWGPMMKAVPADLRRQQSEDSFQLIYNGIFHNDWGPYIQNLSTQGAVFAKMDITFSRWYELVTITRNHLSPYILEEFGDSAVKVSGVMNAFCKLTDFAMQVLTDAYLTEKNSIIQAQQEKQEDLIKELESFAYIVSHDLKTPLRGIAKISEWVLMDYGDKIDAGGKEQLELMKNRVQRLDELIDGILAYSRLGNAKEIKVAIDINKLIADAGSILMPAEPVTMKVQADLPVITYERSKLLQVFTNLIGNAIKYNDKSECVITITCKEDQAFYTFSVHDNGPGIEEIYHEKVFKIFQTLNNKAHKESTGIGLAIVKKIIESEGGKIWIESEKEKGAAFVFTVLK